MEKISTPNSNGLIPVEKIPNQRPFEDNFPNLASSMESDQATSNSLTIGKTARNLDSLPEEQNEATVTKKKEQLHLIHQLGS